MSYTVPCVLCGDPVSVMTELRRARLCGGDRCRNTAASGKR